MIIVEIAGHLGADPEVRHAPNGDKYTVMRVATNRKTKEGEMTIWWRVTLWGTKFDKMIPYFKKGHPIIVVGEMTKADTYTDKEGRAAVSLDMTGEIIKFNPFFRPENDKGQSPGQNYGQPQGYVQGQSYGSSPTPSLKEDFVPYQPQASQMNAGKEEFAPFTGSHVSSNQPYGSTSSMGQGSAMQNDKGDQMPF